MGAYAVGKTSLVARFVHSLFSEKYHTTLGVRQQAKFIHDLLDSFRAEMGSKDEGISDPTQAPDLMRCAREGGGTRFWFRLKAV